MGWKLLRSSLVASRKASRLVTRLSIPSEGDAVETPIPREFLVARPHTFAFPSGQLAPAICATCSAIQLAWSPPDCGDMSCGVLLRP